MFALRRRIADDTVSGTEETAAPEGEIYPAEVSDDLLRVLTKKEREVVDLICLGYSNGDIAKLLFISEHTVKDHTKKIYPKLGVHSRFELASLVGNWRSRYPQ
ncbi:MAG: helix-turn-helix transcriptional regulator [Firmicutes bacterium]|nr:helix-turn-helix transcriptional regulator [Bacillota bacterium]